MVKGPRRKLGLTGRGRISRGRLLAHPSSRPNVNYRGTIVNPSVMDICQQGPRQCELTELHCSCAAENVGSEPLVTWVQIYRPAWNVEKRTNQFHQTTLPVLGKTGNSCSGRLLNSQPEQLASHAP